jgi:hypothetical protein
MTAPLLPQAFWFRLAMPCRRIDDLPRTGKSERLLDLPASCRLPATASLDGLTAWADVRAAWNPRGLAVSVEAAARPGPGPRAAAAEYRPEGSDGLQLWIDTRDTRTVSRATRFCHKFSARLHGLTGSGRGALRVEVQQKPIARAIADAPMGRVALIQTRAERLQGQGQAQAGGGWRLELYLPAEVLHGFDPDTNRRLGFAYQVTDPDPEREDQFLGVGREFPVGENPSLWSTLELRDPE